MLEKRPMKIAVLSELFPPYLSGGGERRYYEICKRLVKRGHEVHVYTMRIEGSPKNEILDGIHIHRMGTKHPLRGRKYLPLATYFLDLLPMLTKEKFDVIDANAYISALGGYLPALFRGTPIVCTIHDIYGKSWAEYVGKRWALLGRSIEKTLLHVPFTKIITVSDASKKLLVSEGVDKKSIVVIHNGVDYKTFAGVKSRRNRNKIIYVGRFVELKNIPDLLKAFVIVSKKNPKSTLELIGDGPLKDEIQKTAESYGVGSKVKITGFLEYHNDLAKKMAGAGVFVTPSLQEGFGIVLLESMAAGTPVVAYDLEAYNDFADSGNTCLLSQKNCRLLAKNILRLMENKKLRQRIIAEGNKTAKKYSWESVVDSIEELYNSISSKKETSGKEKKSKE